MSFRLELLVSGGALFVAPIALVDGDIWFAASMAVLGAWGAFHAWGRLIELEGDE